MSKRQLLTWEQRRAVARGKYLPRGLIRLKIAVPVEKKS